VKHHPTASLWIGLVLSIWMVGFGSARMLVWQARAQEESGGDAPVEATPPPQETSGQGTSAPPAPETPPEAAPNTSASGEPSSPSTDPTPPPQESANAPAPAEPENGTPTPVPVEGETPAVAAGNNLESIVEQAVQAPLPVPDAAPLPEEGGGETASFEQAPSISEGMRNGGGATPLTELTTLVEQAKDEAIVNKGVEVIVGSVQRVAVPEIKIPPQFVYADAMQILEDLQLSLAKVEVAAAIRPRLDRVLQGEKKTLLHEITNKYKTDLNDVTHRADELNQQMQELVDLLQPLATQTPTNMIKTQLLDRIKGYRDQVNALRSLEGLSVEVVATETQ